MRQLFIVTVMSVLALPLSACTGAASDVPTPLRMPAEARQTGDAPPDIPTGTDDDPVGPEAEVGMDECLVVAAGVSSVLLAPLSFMGRSDPEAMGELEDQLHELQGRVPGELKPHFTRIADAAEGEQLGAGDFDEPAFRAALEPVQAWLEKHCDEPAG